MSETITQEATEFLEEACEVLHDALHSAVEKATGAQSTDRHIPWKDLPERNKEIIRVGVTEFIAWLYYKEV
jgi:hypothetical protein